jgi:SAM-dependent methyltransferase
MDRIAELRKYVTCDMEGIEIGPFFNPLVPKREGFRSISIDVFTQDQLREYAQRDPNISDEKVDEIESVDLIGPAQDLARLVLEKFGDRRFDYIVSSHNLEHIPDPIRFLQGCSAVLKPGGYLSMAVPDHRCCFDYFLPPSTLADWLEAYFEKRAKPTDKQLFMRSFLRAEQRVPAGVFQSFDVDTDPREIFPMRGQLYDAYQLWKQMSEQRGSDYIDAHCWMFTPSTFRLLLLDLQYLGLLPFVATEIHGPYGNEFYAHLRAEQPIVRDFEDSRTVLTQVVAMESRKGVQPKP